MHDWFYRFDYLTEVMSRYCHRCTKVEVLEKTWDDTDKVYDYAKEKETVCKA